MKRLYYYIIVAVIVVATGGYFLFLNSDSEGAKYRTEKVARGDVVVQVRATGTINPVIAVQVGSQVSGTIAKLFADYNSVVRQGQIIAQIDSTFLHASVREAEANLQRSQAQVNEARRSLKRTEELYKKELVSQADFDAAQTNYETAQAQFMQSEAALDRARVNLRYSVIRAPIDGVVISRDVDVGQTVAASLQAPRIFTIAKDLKRMQVEASVDEADIGQIHEGQNVTFTVDAYPQEEFRGKVTLVRLSPVIVQNVVTYTVIIEVPNEDMKLRPGMTATVSILVDKREDVLRVPALALRFQPTVEVLEKIAQEKDKISEGQAIAQPRERGEASQSAGTNGQFRGRRAGAPGGGWRRDQGKGGEVPMRVARVWVMEKGKTLKQLMLRTGLSDSRYIEVVGGDIKEGDEIIVGSMTADGATSQGQQSNPFAPRTPGGGGRTRGM